MARVRGHNYSAAEKKKLKELYIQAIKDHNGLLCRACEAAGIGSRNTILKWRKEDPAFNAACDAAAVEAIESTLDVAEESLLRKVKAGDVKALKFYLSCKGKSRGYDLRQEIDVNATLVRPRVVFEGEEDADALQD